MSVNLTPQTEAEIRRWIETGRFADAESVVHTALAALKDQEEGRLDKLRDLVLAGHTSRIAGELTEEMMDEIERSAEERFLRGEEPRLHARP
jgi:putative addiction module CopG family antidote